MTTVTDCTDKSASSDIENSFNNTPIVIASNFENIDSANIVLNEDLFSFLRPKFEEFDLKTLLLTSPLGKSILNYYGTYKKLDNTRRNRLVSIIIKHLYNYIVKK